MTLVRDLRAIVGDRHVLTDRDVCAPYERDWTGRFSGRARAVVRPAATAEVADVLRACAEHGASVVPQGGNTGLVGGGVPREGEVLLSLTRLRGLGAIDPALGQVEVGAGTPLAALQQHAAPAGLDAGLDFAARDSATIGGVVACDAGGARALRHGTARARVGGLEAVLPDGSIVRRLAGLAKDNAGFNLPALLIGSEGTLGVITKVLWRLVPRLPARVAALVPLANAEAAADLLATLFSEAPSLEACELMTAGGLDLVLAHQRRQPPVERAPIYVLAELAARHDPMDELAAALERAGVEDAAIADDTASRERLWTLREGHAEAVAATGVPHKLDIGVPLAALPRFLDELPGIVDGVAPGAQTILWGHLGDGNVHVNIVGAERDDEHVDDAVLRRVLACGGTISAEHGIGIAKARWLLDARGRDDVRAMRAVKAALDPPGLLNPGVVLHQTAQVSELGTSHAARGVTL
jgi:FAD/FMN-containing dehydrogenase